MQVAQTKASFKNCQAQFLRKIRSVCEGVPTANRPPSVLGGQLKTIRIVDFTLSDKPKLVYTLSTKEMSWKEIKGRIFYFGEKSFSKNTQFPNHSTLNYGGLLNIVILLSIRNYSNYLLGSSHHHFGGIR